MGQQVLPIWAEWVRLLGTPLAALVAAVLASLFAYRHWRTAQNKLKLDLFDRRLAIYQAACDLVTGNRSEDENEWDAIERLSQRLDGALWLLDQNAYLHLKGLVHRLKEWREQQRKFIDVPSDQVQQALIANTRRWRELRARELPALEKLFEPYLSVRH